MKKYCMLLFGCGNKDGAEINEAVFCLLALSQQGIEVDMFAPDREQYDTINYLTGEAEKHKLNILQESARIARGEIQPLSKLNPDNYAALILPGGYGALKNSTNFGVENHKLQLLDDVSQVIKAFHKAKKPLGAVCIYPSVLAILFKETRIKITTGLNPESKKLIDFTKAEVILADSDEIVVDETHRIVSTAAFMNDASLAKVYTGIFKMVEKMEGLEERI